MNAEKNYDYFFNLLALRIESEFLQEDWSCSEEHPFFSRKNVKWLLDTFKKEELNFYLSSNRHIYHDPLWDVSIEKELDPLKILMMWNWVDWSCLNFYEWQGNFMYVITNAIDVNKSVFYVRDNKEKVIWRVLLAIDEDKKAVTFKLYKKWNPKTDVEKYCITYIKDYCLKLWLWLNWDPKKVKNISWAMWYVDHIMEIE